jgi:hypothetical protein
MTAAQSKDLRPPQKKPHKRLLKKKAEQGGESEPVDKAS